MMSSPTFQPPNHPLRDGEDFNLEKVRSLGEEFLFIL